MTNPLEWSMSGVIGKEADSVGEDRRALPQRLFLVELARRFTDEGHAISIKASTADFTNIVSSS